MRILLTGVTGYIGHRLLIALLEDDHEIICCVRDKSRFNSRKYNDARIRVVEVDFLEKESLENIPDNIDACYYLIHSMSSLGGDFSSQEKLSAENFRDRMNSTSVKQVIYLSGIVNERELSKHLSSRKAVEEVLSQGNYHLVTLRAGIIVGSGSASFEIIRDLVEKLPVMIAPRWLNTRCQPVSIRNVIQFLKGVLGREDTYGQSFDIGGKEILTYKDMLVGFARARGLKRYIFTVPVMTPKLSSYWLYFITSTSYPLAKNLVESMKIDVVARPNDLAEKLGIELLDYKQSIDLAFDKIKQNDVLSSWYDSFSPRIHGMKITSLVEVPTDGCFKDSRSITVEDESRALENIYSIGGNKGWYANWLWGLRGFIDKMAGGVGRSRGRKNVSDLYVGNTIDFWRVIYESRQEKRLLLFAEMKLPGEAWLEFQIRDKKLFQTATFRPLGLWGRIYWYAMLPFHGMIFSGMLRELSGNKKGS